MATIFISSTHGSDDPTRATLPLLMARSAANQGHQAEVALMGEAVSLMRTETANALNPVGWPNAGEVLREVIDKGVKFWI
ncbi:MAG TPA: DsrE family protein [Tepidiformaceae bacterium]